MKWFDVIWSLFVCVCVLCVYICLCVALSLLCICMCVCMCVCVRSREKLDRRNWGCVCVIMLTCVYVRMSHVCVCECVATNFVWLGSYNDVVNRGSLIGVAVNGLWTITHSLHHISRLYFVFLITTLSLCVVWKTPEGLCRQLICAAVNGLCGDMCCAWYVLCEWAMDTRAAVQLESDPSLTAALP